MLEPTTSITSLVTTFCCRSPDRPSTAHKNTVFKSHKFLAMLILVKNFARAVRIKVNNPVRVKQKDNSMIINVADCKSITSLKRAFDQLLLFLIEQDATEVRGMYIATDIWRGCERLQFVNPDGQQMPINIDRYPDGQTWLASGIGEFQYVPADAEYAPTRLSANGTDGF